LYFMTHQKLKTSYFLLEGINSFATAYYFNYLFFYTQRQYGFGNFDNLVLSACNGLVYMCTAWYGGRFGQSRGYFSALTLGFGLMLAAMAAGTLHDNLIAHGAGMVVWTLGMCFTWPNLEALASEGESRDGLKQMVGIYNVVWAAGAALAFFIGGALIEVLGWKSMFWLPGGLHLIQLLGVLCLKRQSVTAAAGERSAMETARGLASNTAPAEAVSPGLAKSFLRMAWVANPFAYIAINTAIPLIPGLARRFELTPALAGFFCSTWMFSRLVAFVLFWRWTRWHYRFRWLVSAYVLLMASFVALLLASHLWAVILAQITFGWAIGLIYYSSLFYSMDTSDTKGAHGGMHESAIGFVIFAGPAVGAAALRLVPGQPHASTWAVSGILLLGLATLLGLRTCVRRRPASGLDNHSPGMHLHGQR
jgi:predicted MFS family arabinose efflux permease